MGYEYKTALKNVDILTNQRTNR